MPIGYRKNPQGFLDRLYRWAARQSARLTPDTAAVLMQDAQEGFRRAQRLAYDCVEDVGRRLQPGISEIEAAQMLADYLHQAGCDRYIHRPFAWFGEHSRFEPYQRYDDYHPGARKLQAKDVVILDVSPVVEGYTSDIGYTFSLEANEELARAQEFLRRLRADLPALFVSALTPKDIWLEVDRRIAEAGYDNIHAKYPFCVLGHRVFKVKKEASAARRIGIGSFGWFSLETNLAFLKTGFSAALAPENDGSKTGLWAIEPHIGWPGGGAKFEEIMVVSDTGARWLDDDVPHLWQTQGLRL
ncbi:MAG: M24 family metallopeptidase [Neisseria sp.]|nr:M24 family metallopeptidase [Neisseria sp.]